MKKIITIILLLSFLSFVGYKVYHQINRDSRTLPSRTRYQSTTVVKVWTTRYQLLRDTLKTFAEVTPVQETTIQPRVSGQLLKVLVKEGDEVKAGQLLAELDDHQLRLQLLQSENNLAIMNANLDQAQLRLDQAAVEKERYAELLRHRYVSQREYDNVESSYLSAQTALAVLKEQIATAEANHELIQLQLAQTKIHSPLRGVVLQQNVTAGLNITTGTTLFTIAPLNPVTVKFHIDQKEATKIGKGTRLEFTTDAAPGQIFTGHIEQASPSYDSATRTLTLTAILPNEAHKLEPGMFGTAELILHSNNQAITVPQEALVTMQGQNGVFIVDAQKTARFKPVETGIIVDNLVEIISGLEEGDAVVVIGQTRLRDGQKVEILESEEEQQLGQTTTSGEGNG